MGLLSRTVFITGAGLFLECCAFYLVFGMVAALLGLPGAGLSLGLVFFALCWVFIMSLYVQTLKFTANLRGALGLGASAASFVFLIALDAGFSFSPFAAVARGSTLATFEFAFSVAFMVVLWWRGSLLAQETMGLDGLKFSFQWGAVALVVALLAEGLTTFDLLNGYLIAAYFGVGLAGLALARFSSELGEFQDMSLDWWAPIAGSVAGVLLLGLIATAVGLGGLDEVLRQLLGAVGEAGGWIIQPVILIIGIIAGLMANLVNWISGMFGGGDLSQFDAAVSRIEQFQQEVRQEASDGGPPRILIDIMKWTAFLGGLSLAGWIVYRLFRVRGGWRTPSGVEEVRESLFSWGRVGQDMSAAWAGWWRGLAGSRAGRREEARQPRTPREVYYAMVALAGELGQPRREWQTPREHQWDLQDLMPVSSVAGIVNSFQQACYGEREAGEEELTSLQGDWQSIKQYLAQQELEKEGPGG